MRLRLNDVSYTVSEMPRDNLENITQDDELEQINDEHDHGNQDQMNLEDLNNNIK